MAGFSTMAELARLHVVQAAVEQGLSREQVQVALGGCARSSGEYLARLGDGRWPCDPAVLAAAIARHEAAVAARAAGQWQPRAVYRQTVALTEQVFGLPVGTLVMGGRTRPHVRARQALVLVLRRGTDLSFPQIGTVLGIDHSSACQAHKRAEVMEQDKPPFARAVQHLAAVVERLLAVEVPAFVATSVQAAAPAVAALVVEAVARQQVRFAQDCERDEREVLNGLLGGRGTGGVDAKVLPRELVLGAQAMRQGSRDLLAAIAREFPARVRGQVVG